MPNRFQDKVVIVTGSSSGIGRATALAFAAEGAFVVIHGRDELRLKETVTALLDHGVESSKFLVVRGAIEDDKTPKDIVGKTLFRFGHIDILVNNAGASARPGCDVRSIDNLDFLFKVNFKSIVVLTQLALPYIKENKGTIINVSSIAARKVYSGSCYYGALKAALNSYGRSLAIECAPDVRVNTVLPGITKTNIMSACLGIEPEKCTKIFDQMGAIHTLLGRAGDAEGVANSILFLASDEAGFVTGQEFVIDGGDSLTRYPPFDSLPKE